MGTNGAIDVAVGLVLMYLVLSLTVTVVNESISNTLELRASTLGSALDKLIDDPDLKTAFDNHGLIAGLNAAVAPRPGSSISGCFKRLCQKLMRVAPPGDNQRIAYLSSKTFALAVIGSMDREKPIPGFDDIKNAVQGMGPSHVRDALLSHLTQANGDMDKLRDHIAGWFDSSMDRVGGLYKRDVRWISSIVGLIVVVVLNADTVKVSKALWSDASLRAGVVQSAGQLIARNADAKNDDKVNIQKIRDDQEYLRPLPIGWTSDFEAVKALFGGPVGHVTFVVVSKLIGLLMSALAISLGAPFWFDLLGLFMHIRGTGTKPNKAQSVQV